MKELLDQIHKITLNIIKERNSFLATNWIIETLLEYPQLISDLEDFNKIIKILRLKDVSYDLQIEMREIFDKNNLKLMHYIFIDGDDYQLQNEHGLVLTYHNFLNSEKGKESLKLVDRYFHI